MGGIARRAAVCVSTMCAPNPRAPNPREPLVLSPLLDRAIEPGEQSLEPRVQCAPVGPALALVASQLTARLAQHVPARRSARAKGPEPCTRRGRAGDPSGELLVNHDKSWQLPVGSNST